MSPNNPFQRLKSQELESEQRILEESGTKNPFYLLSGKPPEKKNELLDYGKTIVKGVVEGFGRLGRIMGPLSSRKSTSEQLKEQTENLDELLPTDEGFIQGSIRKGLREAPTALSFPGTSTLGTGIRAASSGLLQESAEQADLPEWAQTAAGIAPYLVPGKVPKLNELPLGEEGQALRKTAQDFNLRKFSGIESEKPPFINPIVSEKKEAKLAEELSKSSKEAIDNIIQQKIPVRKLREMGTDLEDAYTKAYDASKKTASLMKNKNIDISNVLDFIEAEISSIKNRSPSPSKSDKIYLDILKNEKKNLIQPEKPGIDVITGKKLFPQRQKNITANHAINQRKNYNSNVKGIWRKPEFSGSENVITEAYANLNKEFLKSIEKANPTLAKELSFADRMFSQTQKLEQVDSIISKSFSDGYNANKLSKTLSNKRERAFLERSLGKDSVQDLERIAKYGQEAEKRVFNQLKNPTKLKEYIENMTPAQLALLVGVKGHVGLAYSIPKAALNRIQGLLFTRNSTKKAYMNFLKEASKVGDNPQIIFKSADRLQKSIDDEFGSEEELMKMSHLEE